MNKILVAVTAIALMGLLGRHVITTVKITANAYLYGYPLVIMEETRKASDVPPNQLSHSQHFPDHTFRTVVRANLDTLYSNSWLDLSAEPYVLSVPDTADRYYVMPFMDAWTNVFATVGTRTTGNGPGNYALVGPDWQGDLPDEVTRIAAPTNMVWLIGRIQTNGRSDIEAVGRLQQQFHLTALSSWQRGERTTAASYERAPEISGEGIDKVVPIDIVNQMNAAKFFSALKQLMAEQPPAPEHQPQLDEMARLGLYGPDSELSGGFTGWLMDRGLKMVRSQLAKAINSEKPNPGQWSVSSVDIGEYGTDYKLRAGVALVGLGALPAAEAVYPSISYDGENKPLNGQHRYRVHFPAGEAPPVNAFWSLTMYDEQGFMIDNPIKRYAIGDRDDLVFNNDGSLDIYIQHKQPEPGSSNWLPSPQGNFTLTMRLYYPQARVFNGSWSLRPVERL